MIQLLNLKEVIFPRLKLEVVSDLTNEEKLEVNESARLVLVKKSLIQIILAQKLGKLAIGCWK